jgi:hypothetical protein
VQLDFIKIDGDIIQGLTGEPIWDLRARNRIEPAPGRAATPYAGPSNLAPRTQAA